MPEAGRGPLWRQSARYCYDGGNRQKEDDMRKKNYISAAALLAAGTVFTAGALTGCASGKGVEQRYAYPLGTASPEDTVTQIYAERFVEEVDRLSEAGSRSRFTQTVGWEATGNCWRAATTGISPL